MIANNSGTEQLSTFVSNALRALSPGSKLTIEHAVPTSTGETFVERAVMPPAVLRMIEAALRSRAQSAPQSETYLQAPAVARLLGIKTGTLAKWRRLETGPKGWARTSRTTVVYPLAEVNAFITNWKNKENPHAHQHEKLHEGRSRFEVEPAN